MEVRDIVIWAVAALIAASALVRLMLVRHNRLLAEARDQVEQEQRRRAAEARAAAAAAKRAS
ncbi:MAG: hypothetical protein K1X74_13250 [Pirellulales bacterium]|nr:hypothetical protein [Pirellulales bacterium]